MQTEDRALEQIAAAVAGRSLLFVTSGGDAAETRFAVDPEIAAAFESAGVRVNETTYDRLDEETARAHDAVILGAFPKTDAPELCARVLGEILPALLRAAEDGTGLLLMVDDHYARIFVPLNSALAHLGLEVLCEDVRDADPARNGRIPSSPEILTLVACAAPGGHPATGGARSVLVPNNWQCGAWPLLATAPAWSPLLLGSPTSEARVLRHAEPGRGGKPPVLAAARTCGAGRIAVLPAHNTFFFGNGLHPRWGRGLFLRSHDNPAFLAALLGWLASARPPRPAAPRIAIEGGGVMPWFNPVPADEQKPRGTPQRGLVAARPALDGSGPGVADLAAAAAGAGFSWAVFAPREEDLGPNGWKRLVDACREASGNSFAALPGVDFCAAQDFGARGLAVLPDFWPPRGTNRRFVIQMIEEGGGWQIFSAPWAAPVPPWNIGGFQGMEICAYAGPAQEPAGRDEASFYHLQSHDWFLAPVARYHAGTPDEIRAAAAREESTYALAPDAASVAARLPRVGHCEFAEVFVSGGPLLREFWMEGPGMTRDVWEGRYYTWSDDPAETALLHMDVACDRPLSEVVLWESGRVLARFVPDGDCFRTTHALRNTRCSRSYWLTAMDCDGRRMVGMARRTKSGLFRAHGGGDRMNTYGSVIVPSDRGEFSLRGQRCSTSATMLFGLGWRQHQLNIYPPVPAVDYQPEGGEWGAPHGRLERIYLNPLVETRDGTLCDRPLENRAGFDFTSDEAALLEETIALDEVLPLGAPGGGPDTHLEKFSPEGSLVREMRAFGASGSYLFGRWEPRGGPVLARFERELVFRETVRPIPRGGIAARLLRMQADSAEFVGLIYAGGSRQAPCEQPFLAVQDGMFFGNNTVAGVYPQPYGAFGFVQLEGPGLVVRTTTSGGVAALEAGLPLPPGGAWLAGERIRVVFLLVVSGLPDDGAALFRELHEVVALPAEQRCEVTCGRFLDGAYPVSIESSGGAASWTMRARDGSGRIPFFAAVRGLRRDASVWAREEVLGAWLPLATNHGTAYFTVPRDWTQITVGTPVIVETPGVAARFDPDGDAWRLEMQNNTTQPVLARWRTNPRFPWRAEHAGEHRLEPGAVAREFFTDLPR